MLVLGAKAQAGFRWIPLLCSVIGREFLVRCRSRISPEVWVANFACTLRQKARCSRAFCGLGDLLQCPFRHDISCASARLAAVAESGRTARLRSGKPWCTLGACPYGCLPCVLNSSTI